MPLAQTPMLEARRLQVVGSEHGYRQDSAKNGEQSADQEDLPPRMIVCRHVILAQAMSPISQLAHLSFSEETSGFSHHRLPQVKQDSQVWYFPTEKSSRQDRGTKLATGDLPPNIRFTLSTEGSEARPSSAEEIANPSHYRSDFLSILEGKFLSKRQRSANDAFQRGASPEIVSGRFVVAVAQAHEVTLGFDQAQEGDFSGDVGRLGRLDVGLCRGQDAFMVQVQDPLTFQELFVSFLDLKLDLRGQVPGRTIARVLDSQGLGTIRNDD
jgi:hypothetical protein